MSEATVPWNIIHLLNMPHQEMHELPNQNSTQLQKLSELQVNRYNWVANHLTIVVCFS